MVTVISLSLATPEEGETLIQDAEELMLQSRLLETVKVSVPPLQLKL